MNVGAAGAIAARMLRRSDPYVFVDGAWLRAEAQSLMKRYFEVDELPHDWFAPFNASEKTFYFDALPGIKPDQTQESFAAVAAAKQFELDYINSLPNVHVRSGVSFHRRRRGMEQKGVDILLAIQALTTAYRGTSSNMMLVLGDLDFAPLVEELVAIGVSVKLLHSHATNAELVRAADTAGKLTVHDFQPLVTKLGFALPQQVASGERWNDDEGEVYGSEHHTPDASVRIMERAGQWQSTLYSGDSAHVVMRSPKRSSLIAYMQDFYQLQSPS